MAQDFGSPCPNTASIKQTRPVNKVPPSDARKRQRALHSRKNERASWRTRPRQSERAPAHKEKHEQTIPVHSMHHCPLPKEDSRRRTLITHPTMSCNPTKQELANSFPLGHGAQHLSTPPSASSSGTPRQQRIAAGPAWNRPTALDRRRGTVGHPPLFHRRGFFGPSGLLFIVFFFASFSSLHSLPENLLPLTRRGWQWRMGASAGVGALARNTDSNRASRR